MRHSSSIALLLVTLAALGCEGHLIDDDFPVTPSPPPPTPPVLALRMGDLNAELVADAAADPAGNVYLAGTFTGTVDFDPGPAVAGVTSLGGVDVFVAKYSGAGAFQWVARIGGTAGERATALLRDAAGDLYVAGAFEGSTDFDPGAATQALTSLGGEDGFVTKLSAAGALLWVRRFGGIGADQVTGIALDGLGRVFATGTFTGSASPAPALGPTIAANNNGQDAFLLGLDATGVVEFAFGVGGSDNSDVASGIAVTTGGVVVIGGSFRGSAGFIPGSPTTQLTSVGGTDAFLAAYSGAGEFQWVRAITGLGEEEIRPGGLAADLEGGVVATGTFTGTTDFDPGTPLITRTSLGLADWFAARYDGLGGFRSAFAVGNTGADAAPRPAADVDGTLLLTGWWAGPLDFNPGAGTTIIASLASGGATDIFAAKYTYEGGLLWVSRFGEGTTAAERQNRGAAVVPYPGARILVAGTFFGSPDFDPGATTFRLTSVGSADGFAVLLTSAGGLALVP